MSELRQGPGADQATKRDNIEVEYCPSCRGMWLSRQELEELEDEVFGFGDDEKGTLVFNATASSRKCPQCSKPMKRFKYRLYDLEMDFCEDGHGFWLDVDEDKRILELMRQEEASRRVCRARVCYSSRCVGN
jgi:Zn-finger nucleic acid-binding protein